MPLSFFWSECGQCYQHWPCSLKLCCYFFPRYSLIARRIKSEACSPSFFASTANVFRSAAGTRIDVCCIFTNSVYHVGCTCQCSFYGHETVCFVVFGNSTGMLCSPKFPQANTNCWL